MSSHDIITAGQGLFSKKSMQSGYGLAGVSVFPMGLPWPKQMLRLLMVGVGFGLLLCVMLRWFEHQQVYFPSRTLDATAQALGRPFEEVTLKTSDGLRLHGWFFPADTNSARGGLVVLLFHGNAGNVSHRLPFYSVLLQLGVNVFAFDYRGYGRSEGRPGEEGTYLDAQAAYAWLRARGFAADRIIALGKSLGGGVASELAVREPLGGLILQSTFTSIPDIGADLFPWLPVRWLATIRYDTRSKLPQLKIPVLVMHSRADDIISFRHGEQLFAAANEPKLFWELAGLHNETLEAGRERYREGLDKYLGRYFK